MAASLFHGTKMTVIVDITLATICFANACYPALIGKATPVGEYQLALRITQSPGYGGDVIQFKETTDDVFAIHRVWLGKPKERRLQRLASPDPAQRQITNGCINVMPDVYEKLKTCCSNDSLVVR